MPVIRSVIPCALVLFAATSLATTPSIESRPFAPGSPPASSVLFTRLTAAQTGLVVENPYDDPHMWGRRYREFMGGGMGSGVAAGDFDGDGLVDLYVSTKTKPGRLFRNLGDWKFVDVTEAAGLGERGGLLNRLRSTVSTDASVIWRQGAVFVDVNNDGLLDLYVCRNNAPNLLYINQGNGRFTEEAEKRGLAIVDGSVIGAFADYDRDGWLDVAILTNQLDGTEPAGRTDRLFRNTGHGFFREVTEEAGITGKSFGHAATWLDHDGDGWPDLYIANDFAGPDYLYRNNGDGTFTNVIDQVVPHMPYSSMGADTADINNDGHLDLLVADMATTSREKDRRGLAASREDVLSTASRPDRAPQYMRNALYLGTGGGVFREAAPWAGIDATDWTWSVRFEDFDNDGWVDLHVTNGMVREANNSDLLARMMRALSDAERIRVMRDAPPLDESNLAYRNLAGQGFENVTREWGLEDVGVSFGAATADFDNDGDLDLVYLNYNGGLSIFRNDTTGNNRVQVRLRGTKSNRFGIGAMVRVQSASVGQQSTLLTVARGYAAGSEIVAHFGLGSDEHLERLVVEWPSGLRQEFRDLAANRAYVITESGQNPGPDEPPAPAPLFNEAAAAHGLRLRDESTPAIPDREQVFLPFRTDRRGPGLAIADLDGNGTDDVYVSATTGSSARLLRYRDGAYHPEVPRGLPVKSEVEEGPPLFLDVDGDGAPDLLVTRASAHLAGRPAAYQPVLYANTGDGGFQATDWLPELAINVGAVTAADINGDARLDLFLGARSIPGRYPETPRSFLLRHDQGRFVDISDQLPHGGELGLVKSALFCDVDQDGHPDLLVALEWDFVRYFRNDGRGRFVDETEKAGFNSGGRGWWNSLALGDFNGDGRPDFVVGNLGLNTTYRASAGEPAVLLYGDFAQNGGRLIVEAVHEGDTLYPLRGRAELGGRLPFILRRFQRNDDFARASLVDVFGEKSVANAARSTADNFSSGIFLSQSDGTYRFSPLPRVAQIGPIHGLVVGDFDGDGRLDIAAAQNSDAAIPGFHGGVGIVLLGKGDGTFVALEPGQSGLIIPGSARALVSLAPDDNAAPGLLLTRHGGESAYLLPRAEPGHSSLRLQLRGPSGNSPAVGSKVQVTYSDGSRSWHEITLGGGWLSQSAPAIYLTTAADRRVISAEIHWPDGRRTRHAHPPASGRWEISGDTR
jgi:enediyne biosynthesis protein E4